MPHPQQCLRTKTMETPAAVAHPAQQNSWQAATMTSSQHPWTSPFWLESTTDPSIKTKNTTFSALHSSQLRLPPPPTLNQSCQQAPSLNHTELTPQSSKSIWRDYRPTWQKPLKNQGKTLTNLQREPRTKQKSTQGCDRSEAVSSKSPAATDTRY